jgi:hypothetical protein
MNAQNQKALDALNSATVHEIKKALMILVEGGQVQQVLDQYLHTKNMWILRSFADDTFDVLYSEKGLNKFIAKSVPTMPEAYGIALQALPLGRVRVIGREDGENEIEWVND